MLVAAKQDARLRPRQFMFKPEVVNTLSCTGTYSVNHFCNLLSPYLATAYSVYLLRMISVRTAQESRLIAVSRRTSPLQLVARLSHCISIE